MSRLSQNLFKGALVGVGLAIGAGALYYMRNSSAVDNPNPARPDAPELPKNICLIPQYSHMCENNLGKPRIEMPQIVGSVMDYFLGNQTIAGVKVSHTVMKATDLTPIQNEMNTKKVLGMVEAFKTGKFDPCKEEILITTGDKDANGSQVNYVADGHHRFAACYILERSMNVVAVDDQAQNVLNNAFSFPGVTTADL